jgi:hypothetical protein
MRVLLIMFIDSIELGSLVHMEFCHYGMTQVRTLIIASYVPKWFIF